MTVYRILNGKSDDSVFTVPPETTLTEAAKILAEKRIGTVVISKDGKVADGILSERDVVRVLAMCGAGVLADRVTDHMTTKLVTCTRKDTAESVMQKMTAGRFRHMPVVEEGQMVGIISLGDAVKARLSEVSMEKDALEGMIMGH